MESLRAPGLKRRGFAWTHASLCAESTRNNAQKLRRDFLRAFDRSQVSRAGKYPQRGSWNRFVQLPSHRDRRRVVLFTYNYSNGHSQRRQITSQVGVAEHDASRYITIHVVGQEYPVRRFYHFGMRGAKLFAEPSGGLELGQRRQPFQARCGCALAPGSGSVRAIPRGGVDQPESTRPATDRGQQTLEQRSRPLSNLQQQRLPADVVEQFRQIPCEEFHRERLPRCPERPCPRQS